MIFALLLACSSNDGTADALADYMAAVDAIDTLVAEHATAVDACTTAEQVTPVEDAYITDWSTRKTALADATDMIGQCAMGDGDDAAMTEAMDTMGALDTAVAAHVSEHAGHADYNECRSAETDHGAEMGTMTATLRADHDAWADSIECGMKDMAM